MLKPPTKKPQLEKQESKSDTNYSIIFLDSPVATRTRSQTVVQVPLREAVGANGDPMLIKAPFPATNLDVWKKIVNNYRSDPVRVTEYFQFIIKQHNCD